MNRLTIFCFCALTAFGCEKPQVSSVGTPVTAGGMTFTVNDYDIKIMELHEGDQTFGYPLPILVVPVDIKNDGPDSFTYAPTHKTQNMSEAGTPILYPDPGPEADLPPENKTLINGVYLEKGKPSEQLLTATAINTGETVRDVFLFEVPPESTSSLIFSIPPQMHRGKLPVLVRIPYEAKQPTGPKVNAVGAPVAFNKVSLTIKSASLEYVKTTDTSLGKGYSSKPLLKVSYMIENKSDAPIIYDPEHRALRGPGAKLYGKDQYNRVRFPSTTSVPGQIDGQVKVEPGDKTEDIILFEIDDGGSEATLEFPASQFERTGTARVQIKFDPTQPKKPAELTKGEKKIEKSEDG